MANLMIIAIFVIYVTKVLSRAVPESEVKVIVPDDFTPKKEAIFWQRQLVILFVPTNNLNGLGAGLGVTGNLPGINNGFNNGFNARTRNLARVRAIRNRKRIRNRNRSRTTTPSFASDENADNNK